MRQLLSELVLNDYNGSIFKVIVWVTSTDFPSNKWQVFRVFAKSYAIIKWSYDYWLPRSFDVTNTNVTFLYLFFLRKTFFSLKGSLILSPYYAERGIQREVPNSIAGQHLAFKAPLLTHKPISQSFGHFLVSFWGKIKKRVKSFS